MAAISSLRTDRRFLIVLVLLVALTVAVRLPLLHQSLWLDEVASARVVTRPTLPKMLAQVRRTESTPPAWYAIGWATRQVVGSKSNDVTYLRWLSILFSAASTALVLVYARRILPLPGAALAGAMMALCPAFVEHGVEIRAYALLTLVSIGFAIVLERSVVLPNKRRLAALAGVVALGSFTHYFFFFTLLAGLFWVWVRRRGAPYRWPVTAGACVGLLPFLFWSPAFLHQYQHKLYAFLGSFNLRSILFSYARIFGVFGSSGVLYAIGRLAVLFLVLTGVWLLARRPQASSASQSDGFLCAALAVIPVAAAAALWVFGESIFIERNLLGSGPFAAVALATALSSLPRRYSLAAMGLSAAVLVGICVTMELTWGRANYQGIANALVRNGWRSTGDLIYFGPAPHGTLTPVGWYLPGNPVITRPRTDARICSPSVLLVSYDRLAGPRWLRKHRSQAPTVNEFSAYDHSPLGPRTSTPILVARLRDSRELCEDAVNHGGLIYTVTRK
jgi:hypothetical protein